MGAATTIHLGQVLDRLREMPADSVHMVWTSPPYWGLRSYGTEPQVWGGEPACAHEWGGEQFPDRRGVQLGKAVSTDGRGQSRGCWCQICGAWRGEHGLEPTLALWLANEMAVFREVRRVLRSDGTLWLNCGDAYSCTPNGRAADLVEGDDRTFRDKPVDTTAALPAKNRLMLPARTTPAHEMIYLLSKRPRYFFDGEAIKEPCAVEDWKTDNAKWGDVPGQKPQFRAERQDGGERPATRNKRSVWHMALEPFKGAHFATAPTGIVRPCIQAGTSAKGVCPHCGTPWVRVTEREFVPQPDVTPERGIKGASGQKPMDASSGWDGFPRGTTSTATTGWQPSCACPAHEPKPATVLDPFGGAGTTALVAGQLGRNAILIEVNPAYAEIARARLRAALRRVAAEGLAVERCDLPLFAGATP